MSEEGNSKFNLGRLHDAVMDSYRELGSFRDNRSKFIKLFAGREYGANVDVQETPVNMIEMATSIYCYRLSANSPRAIVTTAWSELRPHADTLRLALDYLCEKIDLSRTLRKVVKDSIFGVGIVKVGINDTAELIRGFSAEGGQPFCEVVSLQDFVFDTTAKRLEDCQFIGNRMIVDAEALLAAERAGQYENVDQLMKNERDRLDDGGVRASEMTTDDGSVREPYRDRYSLWEIWLPFENLMITTDEDMSVVLRVQDWNGPRRGPYHLLYFSDVPDNVMPLPPAALWSELHIFANEMWRKIFRQARRQKSILPFASGSSRDAERIQAAGDGDVVRVDDAQSFAELRFGGPDHQITSLAGIIEPIFSRVAGNLDTAGGLGALADTATQEAIINQNTAARFTQMAEAVRMFVRDILHSLAWWMWTDPYIHLPLVKRLGKHVELNVTFDEREKKGELADYTFDIVPYSMSPQTPTERFKTLVNVLQGVYQPYAQLGLQQGVQLNLQEVLRMCSDYLDLPELNRVLTIGDPPHDMSMIGHGRQQNTPLVEKPPTHSVYERVSRSAHGYGDQMERFARAMAGENLQDKEKAIGGVQ